MQYADCGLLQCQSVEYAGLHRKFPKDSVGFPFATRIDSGRHARIRRMVAAGAYRNHPFGSVCRGCTHPFGRQRICTGLCNNGGIHPAGRHATSEIGAATENHALSLAGGTHRGSLQRPSIEHPYFNKRVAQHRAGTDDRKPINESGRLKFRRPDSLWRIRFVNLFSKILIIKVINMSIAA